MSDNDLVFLVQMSGGSTAGRDKSVINAHVSKQTHSRRRKEKILQAQRTQDLANIQGQLAESSRCSFSSEDTNSQSVISHLSPTRRLTAVSETALTSPSPPNLPEGFHSSVRLDNKAEEYLRFGREVLEPAIHSVGYRGWVGLESPRELYVGPDLLTGRNFTEGNPHIHRADCHKVSVFAVLAYCASGYAVVNQTQHAHHDAINYTISCMKNLREYLDNLGRNINDISEDLIYRLFRAEVLANNSSSSSAHGRLLRNIFEHKADTSSLRLDILANTLFQDNHRALSFWNRPIFDQEWVQQQYQHEWEQASAMFDTEQEDEAYLLSDCVRDHSLRSHLLVAQRLLHQTQILMKRQQCATPSNFFWFVTQCEWLQICLMNYYLDRDEGDAKKSDVTESTSSTNLNLCLALATLYVLQHSKNDVHIRGRPLFRGCQQLYTHMDARLSVLARAMRRQDSESNMEAIVFMLFVTAIAEDHHFSFNASLDVTYTWRARLGQYLVANDITSWETISSMLSRFPYTEQELPTPYTTWFEDLVSEAMPG